MTLPKSFLCLPLILLAGWARAAGSPLKTPEYCRLSDGSLRMLAEGVLGPESPRDPLRGNLFLELSAKTADGRVVAARITNVLHAHPGDQFQAAVSVGGAPWLKSGRQDNPIHLEFFVDGEKFVLTCFEDIQ